MKEKIGAAYDALKDLDIKPTPHNIALLYSIFQLLKEAYEEVAENENHPE